MEYTISVKDYAAGALGGLAGLLVGHPFDTTKVKYQVDSGLNKGTLQVARFIQSHGMVHGFFRGLSIPLISYGLVNSVFFGVYSNTLSHLGPFTDNPCYSSIAIASFTGGAAQVLIACPTEVVKVRLQSQIGKGSAQYEKGPLMCLRNLYKDGGLKRVYHGFTINVIRDLPASVTFWVSYTWMMERFRKNKISLGIDKNNILPEIVCGGMGGVFSWLIIMPFDVIKSRIQADTYGKQYTSIMDCVTKSYKSDGLKIFYRGTLLTAIRAFPVNAAIMVVYQKCMSYLR